MRRTPEKQSCRPCDKFATVTISRKGARILLCKARKQYERCAQKSEEKRSTKLHNVPTRTKEENVVQWILLACAWAMTDGLSESDDDCIRCNPKEKAKGSKGARRINI